MLIHFSCSQGHRLSADSRFVGKRARCPTCQEAMVVPPPPKTSITDSSVMRILGDAEPPPPMPSANEPKYKRCGRCGASLLQSAKVCDECQTYVAVLDYSLAAMRQHMTQNPTH